MKKLLACAAVLSATCVLVCGCGGSYDDYDYGENSFGNMAVAPDLWENEDNYVHDSIIEQDFSEVSTAPKSYFSLDRNTASYSIVRSQIKDGYKVNADGVRIEEMINYFDYNFPAPDEKAVAISSAVTNCPWNADNKLLLAGIKTTEYISDTNANYVFLIDVSGSMSGDSRLGLAKKGFNMLLDGLGEKDIVSVVTYANGVNTVLDGMECTKNGKDVIREAISSLRASGGTNGGDGLERSYNIAQKHFITGGNNRIIIISDGDFNVGMTNKESLKEFIQDKAKSGIYLSTIGVGMGNMRDDMMEMLATNGNGNYAYLDNINEARKVFVDELKSNLYTVAKDAKAGVTFTSAVEKYRLVGYDTKLISEEDFNDEKADTGEIGTNLCVAALYEITLSEGAEGKLADVEVRYKDVSKETEVNESVISSINTDTPSSEDLSFISCVAEFGLILRNSEYKGTATLQDVLTRLDSLSAYIGDDNYKKEFVNLVGLASETEYYK